MDMNKICYMHENATMKSSTLQNYDLYIHIFCKTAWLYNKKRSLVYQGPSFLHKVTPFSLPQGC